MNGYKCITTYLELSVKGFTKDFKKLDLYGCFGSNFEYYEKRYFLSSSRNLIRGRLVFTNFIASIENLSLQYENLMDYIVRLKFACFTTGCRYDDH